jgi:hypothetical protein
VKLAASDSRARSAGAASGTGSSARRLQDFEGALDLVSDQLEL